MKKIVFQKPNDTPAAQSPLFSRAALRAISAAFCAALCAAFCALSCAATPDMYRDIDRAVYQDDFLTGIAAIRAGQERTFPLYPERNVISLYLDKGLLEHYAGNYKDSSQDLQEAERLIEEAYTKSVTANIASYIANDNTKEYPGEDYENIYLNVFNALNYYNSGDLEGAMVEIRKITMESGKLDMLSRKYENAEAEAQNWAKGQLEQDGMEVNFNLAGRKAVNFSDSALARYLGFLFYLGDGNPDDARIELERFYAARAANPHIYTGPVPFSVGEAAAVPPDKARLNIIGFSGLSPVKEESVSYGAFPFLKHPELKFPLFKLPKFTKRRSGISRIEAVVDGSDGAGGAKKFNLELLEDMGAVMEETFNARLSNISLKTYIRVLLKYVAADVAATQAEAYAARRDSSGEQGTLTVRSGATALFAKMAIDLSEGADIRMSRYLPDRAYSGGINLDPGTYTVTVNYYSGDRIIATDEHRDVRVRSGALNLIETISLQ